ncbi:MAG: isocitrate lyase/PEP mutase family protein [Candidatus Dormibacteraeota bacterium]|nr:isocitrate lyase/PEP mutase family protein [Candidatus Dormibacteraeota bacterium]
MRLVDTPLLPPGFQIPDTRFLHPSQVLRQKMESQPYVFGPGIFDPHGAELVMYHCLDAVYLSGYSFAMGHLGTTDMDLYSSVEIADGARRIVSALRKFQLTMAVGDPGQEVPPRHLEIPPVVADMDVGYGNVFNVQRTTELYVNAGLAAAHIEDQVMPKRCGHIAGKALVPATEFVAKLKMARAVADDLGNKDFVLIARTDGVSATEAPETTRGIELAIERGLRYLDSGVPDLLWCEFPTAERGPTQYFHEQIQKRFPEARFAFNYSSSFKWFNEGEPMTWTELSQMGVKFIFITLAAQHAMGLGMSRLLEALKEQQQHGYIELQKQEWAGGDDVPTRSHHLFSGVPYHHHLGEELGTARFGSGVDQGLELAKIV